MNTLDLSGFTKDGLLKLHMAVIKALQIDDEIPHGLEKTYGVRTYSDWRKWSDSLEAELEKQGVPFERVPW